MRRIIRRWLRIEPEYPAMPPEVLAACDECGATRTIQRNLRGEIILSMTSPCVGSHQDDSSTFLPSDPPIGR